MDETLFYKLWSRFAESNVLDQLPDDIEAECERLGITLDYYIEEFL